MTASQSRASSVVADDDSYPFFFTEEIVLAGVPVTEDPEALLSAPSQWELQLCPGARAERQPD